jgi:opacity protein-like surface antigen
MTKKIVFSFVLSLLFITTYAQTDSTDNDSNEIMIGGKPKPQPAPYQKPKEIYFGGGFIAGFSPGGSSLGINPEIGYSPSPYFDIGLGLNMSFNTINADYSATGTKQTVWNYGGGPLVRFYPVSMFFIQGQSEFNAANWSINDPNNSGITIKQNYSASSLIGAIGYSYRIVGSMSYYTMIGMDFLNNPYSPYRDYDYTDANGNIHTRPVPIIRVGFNFYLK